jgi:hypothetical protein
MSRGTRFTFLAIAIVIAIAAVVVLADSSEDDTTADETAATATPTETAAPTEASPGEETPTATPTATPTPKPPPLLTAGKVQELEYTEGETIRFRVRSPTPEEIHVHCYDITREVPAGETITVSFKATIPGICETEFHNSGETIAELRVEPE